MMIQPKDEENRDTENIKLIKTCRLFMILGGMWQLQISDRQLLKNIYFIYSFIIRGGFIVFAILIVAEIGRIVIEKEGVEIMFLNFAVLINALIITTKIIIIQKNKIPMMFRDIIKEEKAAWESEDPDIVKCYSKHVNYCEKLVRAEALVTIAVVVSFFSNGIQQNMENERINRETNQTLDVPFLYQFYFPNKREHLVSVYALNVFFGYCCIVYNSVTHMILTACMVFPATQLKMLQIRLTKVRQISKELDENNVVVTLKKFIVHHQFLIEFVENLNNSTKYITLMEFVLSSLDCASVATQVTKIQSFGMNLIFLGFYFSLMVLEVFVLGWTANEIKVQSFDISEAIYNSDWHLLDEEAKQLILILMVRAQRPLAITIGPFGEMTTETAVMIMKAAYSYVTLMKD